MPTRITRGKALVGSIAGSVFTISVPMTASSVDDVIYIADREVEVVAVREAHSVVGGASAATRLRKLTGTAAPGASAGATVVEMTQSFDLTSTINTVVSGTLVPAATRLAPGDRIGRDFSGTLTNLVGVISVTLRVL